MRVPQQLNVSALGSVFGRITVSDVELCGRLTQRLVKQNQIQFGWGFVVAKALQKLQTGYYLNCLYIEYENMGDPDDGVSVPAFGRSEGIDYFTDLVSSGSRDYLRLPIVREPTIGIAAGFETYFDSGVDGNTLAVDVTTSAGITGVHGKPFGAASNSKIAGVAAVAMPDVDDVSRDVVFARTYFEAADQLVMTPSRQINVAWTFAFI